MQFLKNPKLFYIFKIVCLVLCVSSEIASATLFKEEQYTKSIIDYTNNLYVAGLNVFFATLILFSSFKTITVVQFISGLFIGLCEWVLYSEFIQYEVSLLFIKFCESFAIVLLFLLTEMLSGRMKRLELNTGLVMISTATLSVFVVLETLKYDIDTFHIIVIVLTSSFAYVFKQLIYASQNISPFIIANNVRLAIVFLLCLIFYTKHLEFKDLLYVYWDKHKVSYIFYIVSQVVYSLSEYFCLKYVDLDVFMAVKTISTQMILLYKKTVE